MRSRAWFAVALVAVLVSSPMLLAAQSRGNVDRARVMSTATSRPVSIVLTDVSVQHALDTLSDIGDVRFTFSSSRIPLARRVTIQADSVPFDDLVQSFLKDLGLTARSTRSGILVLTPAPQPESLPDSSNASEPQESIGSIAGRVTDASTGAGISGASVLVEGTGLGAVTGNTGRYRIADVRAGTHTVVVRQIGYAELGQSVTVTDGEEATADFALQISALPLDELVVAGNVVETRLRESPNPVTVITADEIELTSIQRLDELFRGAVPGIVSFDAGNTDYYSQLSVRGKSSMTGAVIKTYIDGIEVTNPNFALSNIDPNMIERVELIRGPQATTLYGSDAIAGVLQVFTKKGGSTGLKRPRISGRATLGTISSDWATDDAPTIRQQRYNLELSGGSENLSYSAGTTYTKEGDWLPKFYDRVQSAYGGMRVTQGDFTASASLRYNDKRFNWVFPILETDYSTFFSGILPLVYDVVQHTFGLNLSYQATSNWRHMLVFGSDQERLGYTRRPKSEDDVSAALLRYNSSKRSVRYNTVFDVDLAQAVSLGITAGLDRWWYVTDQLFSSGVPQTEGSFNIANGRLTIDEWSNSGYFGQATVGIRDALFITGGIRAEDNANFGAEYGMAWAPRIGVSYVRTVGGFETKLRGAWGKAIRPPQPTHRTGLLSGSTFYLPNLEIGPEEQRGWEAGVDLYFDNVSLNATYYNQHVSGIIASVPIDPAATPAQYQYQNVGRITNKGWEFEGSMELSPFSFHAAYSITDSRVKELGAGYSGALLPGDENLSVPRNLLGASLAYEFLRGMASVEVSRIGGWIAEDQMRVYDFWYGDGPDPGAGRDLWLNYAPVTKINLRLDQALNEQLGVFLHLENLTDNQKGQPTNSTITYGRSVLIGARFTY